MVGIARRLLQKNPWWVVTKMEVLRRTVGDTVICEQPLEIVYANFQIVHISPRDFSLRNRIEARAFDVDLFARRASGQALVAAVLAYSAAMTRQDIAK